MAEWFNALDLKSSSQWEHRFESCCRRFFNIFITKFNVKCDYLRAKISKKTLTNFAYNIFKSNILYNVTNTTICLIVIQKIKFLYLGLKPKREYNFLLYKNI